MKDSVPEEHLYLGFSHQYQDSIFPLHTSISLFLLSYCDCKSFKIFLVPTNENANDQFVTKNLLGDLEIHLISKCQLPTVVQSCCLPAVVTKDGKFCRAGLSVVLRHIIQKTFEADPSKKNVLELLGFKKTCLKACAEVSASLSLHYINGVWKKNGMLWCKLLILIFTVWRNVCILL